MPRLSEPDIPKEAKWNAAFMQIEYIMKLRIAFSDAYSNAMANPTIVNIATASSILKTLYIEVEPIIHEASLRDINLVFNEFGEWYDKYQRPPVPFRRMSTVKRECLNRIEEIYRKINVALQQFKILYNIQDSKQDLATRLELISNYYDKSRKPVQEEAVPSVDEG